MNLLHLLSTTSLSFHNPPGVDDATKQVPHDALLHFYLLWLPSNGLFLKNRNPILAASVLAYVSLILSCPYLKWTDNNTSPEGRMPITRRWCDKSGGGGWTDSGKAGGDRSVGASIGYLSGRQPSHCSSHLSGFLDSYQIQAENGVCGNQAPFNWMQM